jgi:5-methylcytosine-specific restriction endonuclease McrA
MALSKKDRQIVHDKFGGKCAYCGCELVKGWHVDHLEPVRRSYDFSHEKRKFIAAGVTHPERENMDNYMPACASCNINKHSMSLEDFRSAIKGFMNHLNNISVQYKIAKRYGLLTENNIEVKFYFETILKS